MKIFVTDWSWPKTKTSKRCWFQAVRFHNMKIGLTLSIIWDESLIREAKLIPDIFVWMNAVNSKTMNYYELCYLLGAWTRASDHGTRRQDHRISLWSSCRYEYRVTVSTWSTVWKGVKMPWVGPIIVSETEKIKLIRNLCNLSRYSWQKTKKNLPYHRPWPGF